MIKIQFKGRHFLLLVIVAVVLCIASVSFYVVKAQKSEEARLQQRAKTISQRVWAVDRVGMMNDLRLIVTVEKYKYLEVVDNRTKLYAAVEGDALQGFDAFLYKVGLIRKNPVKATVFHENGPIGFLRGEKYFNIFVPSLLCFAALTILTVLSLIIVNLILMRKNLRKDLNRQRLMLRESDLRFKELVNQLPEIVWETDSEGRIEYANNLAHEKFSISRGGETFFFDLFQQKSNALLKQEFGRVIGGQNVALQEVLACDRDNTVFPVLLKCSPRYSGGGVVGLRCLGMDVTERVHLEKQLEHDRRVKELGMLASGVAHDLNNILAGVVGYSDLLLIEMHKDSREHDIIAEVHKAGVQAAGVVSDLLIAVRGGTQRKERCDPIALVKDYFSSADFQNLQLENPQITFVVSFRLASATMLASPIHIRKILMNLIINSVEATEEEGTVTTSVSKETSKIPIPCQNTSLPAGDYLCLTVSDEGAGICKKDLGDIFEPFFSTKGHGGSGTGLGLSLVWNAVMDHKAGIQIGHPPKGCEIKIFFPCEQLIEVECAESIELTTSFSLSPKRVFGRGERILVVDDDLRQRQLAVRILSRHGYLVEAVESGEKAVHHLSSQQMDLVIIDMVMGLGIDGSRTYKKILKLWPHQKALIVSGYASEKDVDEVLLLGAHGLVGKPYTVIELLEAVGEALQGELEQKNLSSTR